MAQAWHSCYWGVGWDMLPSQGQPGLQRTLEGSLGNIVKTRLKTSLRAWEGAGNVAQ